MHCVAGRLAALTGLRCDEQYNTTSYSDCCRACQVGLAVKASGNLCNDSFFSYFSSIESFRICCGETPDNSSKDSEPKTFKERPSMDTESITQGNNDGTIILQEDDGM